MNRFFAVVSTITLGLFLVLTVTATQAATALQPPIEQAAQPASLAIVQHTQPVTLGAPADVVLVIDNSESQAYNFAALPDPYNRLCSQSNIDYVYACLNGGEVPDPPGQTITFTHVNGCNNETISDPNFPGLTRGICQPFRQNKEAAYRFIQQLRPGVDRVALISAAENSGRHLTMTFNLSDALMALNTLDVFINPSNASQPNPTGHILCNSTTAFGPNAWKCGSSNHGAGLIRAHDEFGLAEPQRAEAQWVTILVVDGPANRTNYDSRVPWSDPQYGTCPATEQTTPLKCRDADANSRHFITSTVDPLYDADDYARDYGDILGLNPDLYPALGSAGVRLYTIALGKNTVCSNGTYTPPGNGQPATCTNPNPVFGDPDAGEQLLRYIADMGDDGNLSTGPCLDQQAPFRVFDTRADASGRSDDAGLGLSCGNYYFAPTASDLTTITLEIAQQIIAADELTPTFTAVPLSGIAPLTVTFNNLSTGSYTSTLWTFGDGSTSTAISPTHVYLAPGVYTVTLTIATSTASATLTQANYITVRTPNIPGAPADVVLVIDNSESQAYNFAALPDPYNRLCSQSNIDYIYACLNGGEVPDPPGQTTTFTHVTGCNNETISDPNFPGLTRGICQPFRQNKEAAYRFIQQLRPGVDRVALINFNEYGQRLFPMSYTLSATGGALDRLNNMDVYVSPSHASQPNPSGHILCNSITAAGPDAWKCGSSNVGAGLIAAHDEFGLAEPQRPEAQWATILIADGPANRTSYDSRVPWSDPQYGNCPESERTTPLKCRDGDANSRHFITTTVDPLYDADDYARDYGDILGLNPDLYPALGSAGVRLYTIALGKNTVCNNGTYTPPSNGQPATCTGPNPVYGDPDAGEQLLRYIADMGDDGNLSTGPCLDTQAPFRVFDTRADASGRSDDAGLGLHCGNYYFAPTASDLTTITLEIAQQIIAADELTPTFTAVPLSGIAPLTVTFNNLSTGSYASTLWTFGDGSTSTAISPTHVYPAPGAYTVTLTIANITTTASLTRSSYIEVYEPGQPAFSATPLSGTAPLTVTFTNQSTGNYTDWLWNFGDGVTSTLSNPTHTYDLASVYTVTLQASGSSGTAWFTRTNYIRVYQPVQAAFSANPLSGTAPLVVTFTNQSAGDYTDWLWDFGDGITSTQANPAHTYAAGTYTVTLQISGPGGTDGVTRTDYIQVSAPPPQWRIYLPAVHK